MANEIWIWIKEKLAGFVGWVLSQFRKLWRFFTGWLSTISGSTWRKVAVLLPLLFIVYIVIGMVFVNRIDDTVDLGIEENQTKSATVSTIIRLITREVDENPWTPNDPLFQPGWWLDNTPNYQRGMIGALSRFSFELRDQIGRTRGSSAIDPDLEAAAGNLSKEADLWVMDFSTSMLPTTPSDSYFQRAANDLVRYNDRLASGEAVFERRSDNLYATIDRIALDLGASSAALQAYIDENAGGVLPDFGVDNLFYQTKGQIYGYYMLLRAIKQDFATVIVDRDLGSLYDELLVSMHAAATLDPLIVTNGAVDGVLANHLSMQGFYLLRARTQLREVTQILLK